MRKMIVLVYHIENEHYFLVRLFAKQENVELWKE